MIPNTPGPTSLTNSPTAKLLLIGVLSLLLLAPTILILNIVEERKAYRDTAAQEVQAMWGGPQTLGSPVLVAPYTYNCTKPVEQRRQTPQGWITETVQQESQCTAYAKMYPDLLSVQGKLPSSTRARGIFDIPLYNADVQYEFSFVTPDWSRLDVDPARILWNEAYIALTLADTRGLQQSPVLRNHGTDYPLGNEPRNGKPWESALTAPLTDAAQIVAGRQKLSLAIQTHGSDAFYLQPVAREAKVALQSDWKSPSFVGQFLPTERSVNEKGFKAQWRVLALNHGAPLAWTTSDQSQATQTNVGFRQILPVDHYSMTERAVKYVILFIALTFILCYFAERITGVSIHLLQYLLIGLALLLFYTLLLSLSETMGFTPAYWIATAAITLQIGFFVRKLLNQRRAAWISVALLNALYGFLFVLLRLEDHALLAGSVGLFLILGALMYISTRLGSRVAPPALPPRASESLN
jgi:inner membrane protein